MTTQRARAAAGLVFPERSILAVSDLNQGRGVFSEVFRVRFAPVDDQPASVAVKLAVRGPNGDAARQSGAYDREALAYRTLLPQLTVSTPVCHAVLDDPLGPSFVLEDLSAHRAVDQLDGFSAADVIAVARSLGRLHLSSTSVAASAVNVVGDSATRQALRTNTVASLDPAMLRAGLATLTTRWSGMVDSQQRQAFSQLVESHDRVAQRFGEAGPLVLCHGDPRADNLVFGAGPILFDWQQIARQPGVGDLAWLAATSLDPAVRRTVEASMLASYAEASHVEVGDDAYRVGYALPGLAVLYLAQRHASDDRTSAFIATSLQRIGQALVDLEVADLGRP